MKALIFILCAVLMCGSSFAERQKDLKDLQKSNFPKYLQTLTISATSPYSYEGAMNRLERTKPDGYVIESIRYLKTRDGYTVVVKLRKIS